MNISSLQAAWEKEFEEFKEYPEWIMKRQYENFGVEDFKFIWCVLARGTVCVCSNVVWQQGVVKGQGQYGNFGIEDFKFDLACVCYKACVCSKVARQQG